MPGLPRSTIILSSSVLLVITMTVAAPATAAPAPGVAAAPEATTATTAPPLGLPAAEPILPVGPGLTPEDGTARPPAAGEAEVQRQLRSLESARVAASRPLPTTYRKATWVPRPLTGSSLPYNSTAVYGYNRGVPRDSAGVRMALVNGRLYNHPVAQAQDGLISLSDYRLTGEARYLTRAMADGQRLASSRVISDGAWYYPYPFDFELHSNSGQVMRAPWFSAMAQGQTLSLFVRLFQVTGEVRWRNAADNTFNSFLNAPAQGRPSIVRIGSANYLWLEEYPRWPMTASDRTLNGHVFAIFGLYDYQQLTADPVATDLWNGALLNTRWYVQHGFRAPAWISHYCLAHPSAQSAGYHEIHRRQMVSLHASTGNAGWSRISDTLRDDYPTPGTTGQVALAAGRHTGYKFNASGGITATKSVTLSRRSSAPANRRERIKGRGVYLRITSGALAGYHVPENYQRAWMTGAKVGMTYPLARTASIPAGRWRGYQFTTTGTVTSTRWVELTATTAETFRASAVINGRLMIRISSGELANYWLPATGITLA